VPHYVIDPDASQVWIDGSSSVHPVRATATGLTGWITLATTASGVAKAPALGGEIRIDVGRLRSGNPLVDRETRRRIDARHHPEIVGTVTAGERTAPDRLHVTGTIAFRGQLQSVTGEVTVGLAPDRVTVEGATTFDVRTWGLQPPRVGLLRVHPEVNVRIHVVAARHQDGAA
jgi:polyisoprenoid-binding protein YceI